MAFGIGINNENQDAGMIRGSQQDIACECWFTQKGKIIPLMIKVQDEDGEIRCIGRNGVPVVVRPKIYVVGQTVFFKPGLHLLGKGGCLERFVRIFYGGKDVNQRGIRSF